MNIRTIGIIFVASILILLAFQSVWLYNTYRLEEERIQSKINSCFQESVKNDLMLRMEKLDADERELVIDNSSEIPEGEETTIVARLDIEESLSNNISQYLLSFYGFDLELSILDSLLQIELATANYQLNHQICYKDSTGVLLEEVGDSGLQERKGVFVSDSIIILNKKYVQLIADISMPVVLKQMVGLTIASFLMLLILIVALIVQIRYAYNQYRFNKLREDFSHALIHDLKSPLNTIYIALSNFENGLFSENPEFGKKAAQIAIDQVLSIQTLVDRILTIARLETKNMEADRTETDLPRIIYKLTERYQLSAGKKISFETFYELHNYSVFIDATLVEQAISNLIDNAIKYSGDAVAIRITCEIKEKKLFIYVKDNGFGISPDDQLKIFNKFERGSAVFRKGGAKGFGLGLSYARQVTIAHQGTIGLSSVKGEGSEFVLVLGLFILPFNNNEKTINGNQQNGNP